MHQPIVSFIVPIYNGQVYLNECINSLLNQSIEKEIILIDDGSSDDSLSIALDYAKKYPFIQVLHQQNKGASYARNQGIRLAKGEYIHFIDADDYLVGDHYAEVIGASNIEKADIIRVQAEIFYENSAYTISIPSIIPNHNLNRLSGLTALNCLATANWIPGICWSIIRREYLLTHKLFFREGNSVEDQLFYIQLLTVDKQVKVIEYPKLMYAYRRNVPSISNTINDKYLNDHIEIIICIHDYTLKSGLYETSTKSNIRQIILNLMQTLCHHVNQFEGETKVAKIADILTTLSDILALYDIELSYD